MEEKQTIHVQELHISAMVDDSADPYGQPGCFGAWAWFETSDRNLISRLERHAAVTLSCVLLEASGCVAKIENQPDKTKVTIAVDDVRYVRPQ